MSATPHPSRWTEQPRWFLWEGGFLVLGATEGIVPPHAHHAIQIVIAIDGRVAAKEIDGEWREGAGLIVRQDTEHSFDGRGASGAMLFVDPESSEGIWLRASLHAGITLVPADDVGACVASLRACWEERSAGSEIRSAGPEIRSAGREIRSAGREIRSAAPEIREIRELIRSCVLCLFPGPPPVPLRDERIAKVLDAIRKADDLRMPLEEAAELACLSPSRFAHLFKEQLGLPFRRYMLWRKLARAMVVIGREQTIAAAAQASDFADSAHLTRTFYQMFGLPPSAMMRGDFREIDSPFR